MASKKIFKNLYLDEHINANFCKRFEKKKGIFELSPISLTKTKSHIFLFKS